MKSAVAFLSCIALGLSFSVEAQYAGPAVEACRAFAQRELGADAAGRKVVFERDAALNIDKYTRKVGSQFVSSVLTGNGAVVMKDAPSAELSFVCLLANDKKPVFFYWLSRDGASAMAQCSRAEALAGEARRGCFDHLLRVAEQDLGVAYAERLTEARRRDADAKSETFTEHYRNSNARWLEYRNAECRRRRDLASADAARAADLELACTVDLTRRRLQDVK